MDNCHRYSIGTIECPICIRLHTRCGSLTCHFYRIVGAQIFNENSVCTRTSNDISSNHSVQLMLNSLVFLSYTEKYVRDYFGGQNSSIQHKTSLSVKNDVI
ncbi:hypothetical protein BpHYR1_023444 [Brachionus plicatilis]|uniref:Uncharacterized protein n=1 Tax=Brachionus plicatilis TaxID=10195 RepID=A0A3M7Q669_BRAPC|nr:hypothetical protein BpHYR1_023444 [Brachionus plicatilis]